MSKTTQLKEYQVADFLRLAHKRLACSEFILNYPQKQGKTGYNPGDKFIIDDFWKNVGNLFFESSLLITVALLEKKEKVVSFWNLKNFVKNKKKELYKIYNLLNQKYKNLILIRHQLISHLYIKNNAFPPDRERGTYSMKDIKNLKDVQERLIEEFLSYKKKFNEYTVEYFNIAEVSLKMEKIINILKPNMTEENLVP